MHYNIYIYIYNLSIIYVIYLHHHWGMNLRKVPWDVINLIALISKLQVALEAQFDYHYRHFHGSFPYITFCIRFRGIPCAEFCH